MSPSPRLKRPLLLQILAVLFLLAPIGNVVISFMGTRRSDWGEPTVLVLWLSSIHVLDWFWLSLTFSTGILLLIQHKTAWLMAIINLMLILTVNFYRWSTTGELIDVDYGYFQAQTFFSILATLAALAVVFYARYPYLDRRSGWFRNLAPRAAIMTSITMVADDVYSGRTHDLSMTGAMLELNKEFNSRGKMKFVDLMFADQKNLKIKCRVIQSKGRVVRLKFKDLSTVDRQILQAWVNRHS